MNTFATNTLIALALGITPVVWAADPPTTTIQEPAKHAKALKADTNGDGKVTFDEIKAVHPKITQRMFDRIDTNKDGSLTSDEIRAAKKEKGNNKEIQSQTKAPLQEKLKEADKNNDSKVTYEELQSIMPQITPEQFARFDRNKDGVITKDDRTAAENDTVLASRLKEADTNNDGKLSLEEAQKAFPKMTEEQFKKRDTNGDGFISKEDRKKQEK